MITPLSPISLRQGPVYDEAEATRMFIGLAQLGQDAVALLNAIRNLVRAGRRPVLAAQ